MWDEQNHKGTVLDWEAFEAEVAKIDRQTHELKRTRNLYVSEPLYRGQPDATWHLTTTLDRRKAGLTLDKYLCVMERIQPRVESISGMKWGKLREEISGLRRNGLDSIWLFPVKSANTEAILSFMVYLCQHGFPSPLLDWSSNPYTAAFFAFSAVATGAQGVAIYLFREQVGLGTDAKRDGEPCAMGIGPHIENTSERHTKQQAQYTWCVKKPISGRRLDYYVFTDHEQVINLPGFRMEGNICVDTDKPGKPLVAENVVEKYVIPASERGKVLASLAQRNISGDTLFGDTADDRLEDLWNELLIDPTVCL